VVGKSIVIHGLDGKNGKRGEKMNDETLIKILNELVEKGVLNRIQWELLNLPWDKEKAISCLDEKLQGRIQLLD